MKTVTVTTTQWVRLSAGGHVIGTLSVPGIYSIGEEVFASTIPAGSAADATGTAKAFYLASESAEAEIVLRLMAPLLVSMMQTQEIPPLSALPADVVNLHNQREAARVAAGL